METKIIHLNIADFSVAVERLLDRSLVTRPVIVAHHNARAAVLDMSEEAYQDGVRKGMLLNKARKLCRGAIIRPPQSIQYQQMLKKCFSCAKKFSPNVEYGLNGTGHLYLDATGTHRLFGPAPDIGWKLRKTLRQEFQFDPIWSVAPNKMIAKVASRLVKPAGEYIVAAGDEETFLAPLPIALLPGISSRDLAILCSLHMTTISQVKALSVYELGIICGNRAHFLYNAVRGIDHTPVVPAAMHAPPSQFNHFFSPDTNKEPVLRAAVSALASRAGHTLRRRSQGCRKVRIEILYTDSITRARQATSKLPVAEDSGLEQLALTALYKAWQRRVRIRQISLTCGRRYTMARQLDLFNSDHLKKNVAARLISDACDALHEKYGKGVITRGMQFRKEDTPVATAH